MRWRGMGRVILLGRRRVVSWVEGRTVNFVGLGTKDMKFNRSVYQKQILIITIHTTQIDYLY